MTRSRRNFLRLVAATTAAVAARPARTLASAVTPAPAKKPPSARSAHPAPARSPAAAPPEALRAGIAQQQRDLAKALKTLRDYPLPPGSNPAFGFAVARLPRKGRTS